MGAPATSETEAPKEEWTFQILSSYSFIFT